MASAHWQISMLAGALLLSGLQVKPPEAEPASVEERRTEMTVRPIIVELTNGKVTVMKENENQLEVNDGDQVIWRFPAGVDAAGFLVVLRGPNIFTGELKQTATNEISGTIDGSKLIQGTSVEYDVFKKLEWEGRGGCIKPTRPGGGGN